MMSYDNKHRSSSSPLFIPSTARACVISLTEDTAEISAAGAAAGACRIVVAVDAAASVPAPPSVVGDAAIDARSRRSQTPRRDRRLSPARAELKAP